jgi:hypothetical protein
MVPLEQIFVREIKSLKRLKTFRAIACAVSSVMAGAVHNDRAAVVAAAGASAALRG